MRFLKVGLVLGFLGIGAWPLGSTQGDLQIDRAERSEDGVFCVTWARGSKSDEVVYRIFIGTDLNEDFPARLAEELGADASGWCSRPRRSWKLLQNVLGVDLKDPTQWLDPSVLTPGEPYVIGIEKLSRTPLAKPPSRRRKIAYPFAISSYTHLPRPEEGSVDGISTEWRVPRALEAFIDMEGKKAFVRLDDGKRQILFVEESGSQVVLYLEGGVILEYGGTPRRPEFFGSREAVVKTIIFISSLLSLVSLALVWSAGKAIGYLNLLAEEENDPKEVIRQLLENEDWPVCIAYFMVVPVQYGWIGKLLPAQILELPAPSRDLHARIVEVFRKRRIFEHRRIRDDIGQLVEPLEADRSSQGAAAPGQQDVVDTSGD
jgi:hypothetical protein